MSINNIFGIAGSAMNAQMVRMNSSASNMANASTTAGSQEAAYKRLNVLFLKLSFQKSKLIWEHQPLEV